MKRKTFYLIFALLFPVLIFLFLKYFGRNEFVVPPLFEQPAESIPEGCEDPSFPYRVDREAVDSLGLTPGVELFVAFFPARRQDSIAAYRQWARIGEIFPDEKIRYAVLPGADQKEQINYLMKCIFLLKNPNTIVVVDEERRIRGQYDAASFDDVDRLVTEMKIILNKY